MNKKYQTLSQFVLKPFNKSPDANKDKTYNAKYTEFVKTNKIKLVATTVIGESYYYHIKIPSESHKDKNYMYDVVIRFFTDDPIQLDQPSLRSYYVQFFSNSPSFIYHYAYVYKQHGYLIEDLFEKIDGEYENIPPTKTNPNQVLSYDKSIYFATRFLNERKFKDLAKKGTMLLKQVNNDKFFRDIADFESIKFDQTVIAEEKKLQKELDKAGKKTVSTKSVSSGKKTSGTSTARDTAKASITVVKKKNGLSKVITKKRAKKSTYRR